MRAQSSRPWRSGIRYHPGSCADGRQSGLQGPMRPHCRIADCQPPLPPCLAADQLAISRIVRPIAHRPLPKLARPGRPTALANLRLGRDCHGNAKAAEQFSQQTTAALRILSSQAGAQRIQQRRTSHFGKWRTAPGCKTVRSRPRWSALRWAGVFGPVVPVGRAIASFS